MINDNIDSVEVMSASKKYLYLGIFLVVIPIAFHFDLIILLLLAREFFGVFLLEIILLPNLFIGIILLSKYKRKNKFTMHYANRHNVNVEEIQDEYYIFPLPIDDDHIMFVKKEDKNLLYDWLLLNKI